MILKIHGGAIDGARLIGETVRMPRRLATNRIQSALDELGIDWHSPRYGRPRLAGDSSTILVPDRGALGQLVTPLRADGRIDLDARQPPALMRADGWMPARFWQNSARANLARIEGLLTDVLGPSDDASAGSMLSRRWRDQAGSITVSCWPHADRFAETGPEDGPLHQACAIEIVSGWRRPLTSEETRTIDDMTVIGRGTPRGVRVLTTTPPSDDDIGYMREPGHEPVVLDAIIGVNREARTLVACPGRLLVVPIDRISSLRHEAYKEGMSAGHSAIVVTLEGGRSLTVAEHDETHGLELVSRGLSRILELSIERLEAVAS